MITEGIAFIPEARIDKSVGRKMKLAPGLFIVPESNKHAAHLKQSIKEKGGDIGNGTFLYFKSELGKDSTLYEVFQSYGFALTFYYGGRATCRAYEEINEGNYDSIKLFIDEFDKFRYDPGDERIFRTKDRKAVSLFYEKILNELSESKYNPLINSLQFFDKFLREYDIKVRLLFLNICFESLFIAKDNSELVYKLSTRCAHFLGNNGKIDKYLTYIEVKSGYDLRSTIIHGGDYGKKSNNIINNANHPANSEIDHIIILEDILKRVYKAIFSDDILYELTRKGDLGGRIDKDISLI